MIPFCRKVQIMLQLCLRRAALRSEASALFGNINISQRPLGRRSTIKRSLTTMRIQLPTRQGTLLMCWTALLSAFSPSQSRPGSLVQAFTPVGSAAMLQSRRQRQYIKDDDVFQQNVHLEREADMFEQMMGGQRYEMSPLPDSMMQTTLFVGNLCEFVDDDDLSNLFQSVSVLQSVPACVVRKPDMSSRQYGFVSFLTESEKNAAILRFHGYEFRGRPLKVECIRDHPSAGRVQLPESMVNYVSGAVKSQGDKKKKGKRGRFSYNSLRRISRDDVERLSRGQPTKKKAGSRNVPHRLNEMERKEMERSQNKGYLTLMGSGSRRTRKGSPLKNIHRQWCDARNKPQIILYKTTGSERQLPLDMIEVDLSPLRLMATSSSPEEVETILAQYKAEIKSAARNSGMAQSMDVEDDILSTDGSKENEEQPEGDDDDLFVSRGGDERKAWATKPIWQLRAVHAVDKPFWGQRSQAKAMAKELANLWGTQELDKEFGYDNDNRDQYKNNGRSKRAKGGKSKMRGLSQHRKRGGGHRQSWY